VATPGSAPRAQREVRLEDRFVATEGAVLLTGVQAVCRVPIDVRRVDQRKGLNTRAFVTGYQGSPLGTVDFAMRPIRDVLDQHGVDFRPGMNEMMAATAVQGTQSVPDLGSRLDGVTGFWYAKAPGVDQALDAIRHGNLMGTHPDGGVLAFCGDDATAKSSTVPSASEPVLRSALVPVLAAGDSQDVVDLGLHGVALSRATGLWAALKIATNVADGSSVVSLVVEEFEPEIPLADGRPYRHQVVTKVASQIAEQQEQNMRQVRLPLVLEYARLNRLNRMTRGPADRIGIIAAGQPYLEVCQSLADMGLGDAGSLAGAGVRLLKVGLVWPLEPRIVREFADGLDEIIVVEDKGPFLEQFVKDELYNLARRPQVVGARDAGGAPLLPSFGAVDADAVTRVAGPRLLARADMPAVRARLAAVNRPARQLLPLTVARRTPYFCSGCPHNSSTKAPEGALMGGGIGCHAMTVFMDSSQAGIVTGLTQMGGEGAQWLGQQAYVEAGHAFQNLGDGTLAHSGLLAIRANVAAGTNITYKILYNAAVAMTGGQDAVGGYAVPDLTRTLAAEGVRKIVITTEDPGRYRGVRLPAIASVRDRSALMSAQEELSRVPGTTVLIHDQPCAAELRRKRKRGLVPDPPARVMINERICEGCGDCGQKSNCLSVIPVETPFGRKTQIHQPSCNKDYTCLTGDCPSFMVVTPRARPGRAKRARAPVVGAPVVGAPVVGAPVVGAPVVGATALPAPRPLFDPEGFTLRITGIGGTGIVTVAQVIATAAFIDGLSPRGLDQVGLSQKAGPVVSDLRFTSGDQPLSPKMTAGGCDLYLGCDVLVAAEARNLAVADPARTVAVVSTADVATGQMIRHPSEAFPDRSAVTSAIDQATRRDASAYLDARSLAEALLGSDQYSNMVMVGAAFQAGALPLAERSIERAIELNGVAVEANLRAFRRGRQAIANPAGGASPTQAAAVGSPAPASPASAHVHDLVALAGADPGSDLAEALALRAADLIAYQDAEYARRYIEIVARARQAEAATVPGNVRLTTAVAVGLHKLMAYKDEYEVARLALDEAERAKITSQFGEGAKVVWKLHPPVLRAMGMTRKISLGPWFTPAYQVLRSMKRLRGTRLDPFGRTEVRRLERQLIAEYTGVVGELVSALSPARHDLAVRIAELPDLVRGYEHVKLANVQTYRERLATLRAELVS
jgi:indolepyruvate ferredoxin oxidoreductase